MKNSFDRILSSTPVNRTTAIVAGSKGEHWESKRKITNRHWDVPQKCKPIPKGVYDRTGEKFGRFTIIGLYGRAANRKRQWLVRCACGAYETRSEAAIENPANYWDRCTKCRALIDIKERNSSNRNSHNGIHSKIALPTKPFTPSGQNAEDLTGKRTGFLTVVGCSTIKSAKGSRWVVRCDCGIYELRNGTYLRKTLKNYGLEGGMMCRECEQKSGLKPA